MYFVVLHAYERFLLCVRCVRALPGADPVRGGDRRPGKPPSIRMQPHCSECSCESAVKLHNAAYIRSFHVVICRLLLREESKTSVHRSCTSRSQQSASKLYSSIQRHGSPAPESGGDRDMHGGPAAGPGRQSHLEAGSFHNQRAVSFISGACGYCRTRLRTNTTANTTSVKSDETPRHNQAQLLHRALCRMPFPTAMAACPPSKSASLGPVQPGMSWAPPAGCACAAWPTTSLWWTPAVRTTSSSVVSGKCQAVCTMLSGSLHPQQAIGGTVQLSESMRAFLAAVARTFTLHCVKHCE